MCARSYDEETEKLLTRFVDNFKSTGTDTLEAISTFNWLWPLFEYGALQNHACVDIVDQFVRNQSGKAFFKDPRFIVAYEYFLERYATNSDADYQLRDLCGQGRPNLRPNKTETDIDTIKKGLCSDSDSDAGLKALVWITFRLRNNLFHGEKTLELHTQGENFTHANTLLKLWLNQPKLAGGAKTST